MKYIVYLTVNKVNGKIYVGVHKTETPYNFDGYFGCGIKGRNKVSKPQHAFQHAFNKYGKDAFTRHTLAVFDTLEEAYYLESKIVTYKFIESSKTYNVALGGGSGAGLHSSKKIHSYNKDGSFKETYNSLHDAAIANGLKTTGAINHCLNGKSATAANLFWSTELLDHFKSTVKENRTTVYKYTLFGKFVEKFESLVDAAKSCDKVNTTPISNCLMGNRKKAYEHIWKYEFFEIGLDYIVPSNYSMEVHRYNLTSGEYIDSFVNCAEAATFLNKSIRKNISACAHSKRKSAGGFKWSFDKLNKIEI